MVVLFVVQGKTNNLDGRFNREWLNWLSTCVMSCYAAVFLVLSTFIVAMFKNKGNKARCRIMYIKLPHKKQKQRNTYISTCVGVGCIKL